MIQYEKGGEDEVEDKNKFTKYGFILLIVGNFLVDSQAARRMTLANEAVILSTKVAAILLFPNLYRDENNKFWLLVDNKRLAGGCPLPGLPLTKLGLPASLRKIDAVFKWDVNKEFYVFAGDQYWLLDVKAFPPFGKVAPAPEYPRQIKHTWRGIPTPVTSAYTTLNGETLFFHGSNYYAFDNTAMRARKGYPKLAKLGIIGCQES
ncbi:hypothetical protein ACTXT7_002797 [Hymenolepis weldensis]